MASRKESEEAYAKRILDKADKYLEQVDDAFILKQRGHSARPMPTFRPEEISLGSVLGTGGFGVVNEITKFTLDKEEGEQENKEAAASEEKKDASTDPLAPTNSADSVDTAGAAEEEGIEAPLHEVILNGDNEAGNDNHESNSKEDSKPKIDNTATGGARVQLSSSFNEGDAHDYHYEISQARHVMEKRCMRGGKPRYALKRLDHRSLTALEQARGMIDMAVEAKYLSIVWHPNIIKMRGMATGPIVDKDFFIILDLLVETLDKRMNTWHSLHKEYSTSCCSAIFGKNEKGLAELILESMTIAYDLAAAFFYLHENRLVYRDIKPENIGFDMRGDVKVFDFGLCKNLSPQLKAKNGAYGYRLTGRAGSLPYMAPEVAKMQNYDTKCDVFSFAILLWEMLACRPAFDDYSSVQFMDKVVMEEERLPIQKAWPPLTRLMIPEAWDTDPQKRPDMKRMAILIRGDLNDLTTDDRILHRTKHLAERSQHSFNEDIVPLPASKKNS